MLFTVVVVAAVVVVVVVVAVAVAVVVVVVVLFVAQDTSYHRYDAFVKLRCRHELKKESFIFMSGFGSIGSGRMKDVKTHCFFLVSLG